MSSLAPSSKAAFTKNYLPSVIRCIKNVGYELDDFEISTEKVNCYNDGHFKPKSIVYVFRKSSRVEINYILDAEPDFSTALCIDLEIGTFD